VAFFAYLSFLLTFVALGLLSYSLAVGSTALAVVFGLALVLCVAASITGSRLSTYTWARARDESQVDRYLQRYRDPRQPLLAATDRGGQPTRRVGQVDPVLVERPQDLAA
jgi:hypothetical protein